MNANNLATRIMWGLALGLLIGIMGRIAGTVAPPIIPGLEWFAQEVFDPVGQVFLRLLFFIVVPLVFSSLTLGVLQLGRLDKLGPLTGRTFLIFFINMSVSVGLGLLMMNLLEPGKQVDAANQAEMLSKFAQRADAVKEIAAAREGFSLNLLVEMFMPANLLKAIVEFQLLPMILFAMIIGAAGVQTPDEYRNRLRIGLEIVFGLMMRIVRWALLLAPVAVAAMIASVVIKFGLEFLKALSLFLVGILCVMCIHLFGTMSALLRALSKRSPLVFFREIRPVLVTAFSTSSSNATLPTSIQVCRQTLGVSPSTAGFVLPLGATMNMSGTALYEGCVVLFIAQVYGIDLTLIQQMTLLILAVLSAVAVAGIPGGSLPLIVGLLVNFGIPPEGIVLILGTDRLLDMARTTLNVAGDLTTACIVDEQMAKTSLSEQTRLG